jgi:NADPH:quinone reductase-like Zn-dependent oxidoreductase
VDYKLPELPLVGRLAIPKPAIPGLDFSGTIVLSTPSSRLEPGTRVFGKLEPKQQFGSLGEYIVGSAEGTVAIPEGLGMEEASALGVCGLVTYQALSRNVRSGMRVLVNGGSGGTGTFAVQIAKALGAEVVVTCSGESPGGFPSCEDGRVRGNGDGLLRGRERNGMGNPLANGRKQAPTRSSAET